MIVAALDFVALGFDDLARQATARAYYSREHSVISSAFVVQSGLFEIAAENIRQMRNDLVRPFMRVARR